MGPMFFCRMWTKGSRQGKMKKNEGCFITLSPKCWHPKFIDQTSDASFKQELLKPIVGNFPQLLPRKAAWEISRQLHWRLWLRWRWCWAQRICRSKILWSQKVELQGFMKSNSVRRHWEVLVWRRSSCNLVLSSVEGLRMLKESVQWLHVKMWVSRRSRGIYIIKDICYGQKQNAWKWCKVWRVFCWVFGGSWLPKWCLKFEVEGDGIFIPAVIWKGWDLEPRMM